MLRKAIGVVTGTVLIAASASSCVVNDASIIILGILAPPTASSSGSTSACVYQATLTGPFINSGLMDVGFAEQYTPAMLLGNQLIAQGNASTDRIETNNINVEGAIVHVFKSDGTTPVDSYTVLAAAFLAPSSGGTAGLAVDAITIISPIAADAARQQLKANGGTVRLVSKVIVYGTTTGGTHIESGEVSFSVDTCLGCLVVFPSAADDPLLPTQPNCSASSSTGGSTITPPCVYGQDQYVDCRLCSATNTICQP
jgi:hypothetical protein